MIQEFCFSYDDDHLLECLRLMSKFEPIIFWRLGMLHLINQLINFLMFLFNEFNKYIFLTLENV